MARHETDWTQAGEISRGEALRGTCRREPNAIVRFLAGREGWQQASRELEGGFVEPPARSFKQDKKE